MKCFQCFLKFWSPYKKTTNTASSLLRLLLTVIFLWWVWQIVLIYWPDLHFVNHNVRGTFSVFTNDGLHTLTWSCLHVVLTSCTLTQLAYHRRWLSYSKAVVLSCLLCVFHEASNTELRLPSKESCPKFSHELNSVNAEYAFSCWGHLERLILQLATRPHVENELCTSWRTAV